MSKDFSHLRAWITGEGYPADYTPRPVILECIPSRSGMSMGVYDREGVLFIVKGYGFDRIGTALGIFLETCFQEELKLALPSNGNPYGNCGWTETRLYGALVDAKGVVQLDGGCGIESMIQVANAIGLSVRNTNSKSGTLLIITRRES